MQLAGRSHAAYGTDGFDVPLLTLEERPLLVGMIGAEAEQLVYRYGTCDRSRTWQTSRPRASWWTGSPAARRP